MGNLNSRGIDVSPKAAPGFAASRRHFISATTLLGVSWRRWHPPGQWGRYDSDRHGGGGAHCF